MSLAFSAVILFGIVVCIVRLLLLDTMVCVRVGDGTGHVPDVSRQVSGGSGQAVVIDVVVDGCGVPLMMSVV